MYTSYIFVGLMMAVIQPKYVAMQLINNVVNTDDIVALYTEI